MAASPETYAGGTPPDQWSRDMLADAAPASGLRGSAASSRRLHTRSRLLAAAREVFAEEGVQSSAVETICQRAGFTRGAFYSNFSTKEELFLALLEQEFTERTEHAERKAREIEPALRARGPDISHTEVAAIIADFIVPAEHATAWFILETEFLLMALRDPTLAPRHHAMMDDTHQRVTDIVATVLEAAGRQLLVSQDQFMSVLTNEYEAAVKRTSLAGTGAQGGLAGLSERLAELVLALTQDAQ